MKSRKMILFLSVMLAMALSAAVAAAGDFDWLKDLNVRAQADSDGFRVQLSTRFNIGDAQVKVVLGNVDSPADAYMVLRLGEMSEKPVDDVLQAYKSGKDKGWGALAQSLGIKPGSPEFKALKEGGDLDAAAGKDRGGRKEQGKGKGK